jgi:hypothetical protein
MDIMTLLGHTTLQMTSRYTHAMPQNLRAAVDSLNKWPFRFVRDQLQTEARQDRAKWRPGRMELDQMGNH